MPHYSFSTVLMALLASNMLAIVIAVCFLSKKIYVHAGYRLLALFSGLVILRLLLPFEFSFTSNVILPETASKVIVFLREEKFTLSGHGFSIWNLFEIVWVLGIGINVILLVKRQIQFRDYLQKYGIDKTEDPVCRKILSDICTQYNKPISFRVLELPGQNVPFIFGLKHPCIILPGDLSLPPSLLRYILCHEAIHCFRHDLLIKSGIRILSILYWWNPAFLLLWREVDLLQEMGTDRAVTKGSRKAIEEYSECLLCVKKAAENSISPVPPQRNTFFLLKPHSHTLTNRLTMLLQDVKPGLRICIGSILTLLVAGIYLASHLYILEAHYIPPEVEADYLNMTSENSYFIMINSSSYELYFLTITLAPSQMCTYIRKE